MQVDYIARLRESKLSARDSPLWFGFVNALNLLAGKIFARSSHFLLELIQNAEDVQATELNVHISANRVKVVHNGRPFSPQDVDSICNIGSAKRPELGTLGYLGIGFKSVFKITDCPEIYSGGFQFKFDRFDELWRDNPRDFPWQIIPGCIKQPPEEIDRNLTTFILPFKDEDAYSRVADELKRLNVQLHLFLRWLRRVTIEDEVSHQTWTFENSGERDGIVVLRRDETEQAFRVFRKQLKVPDEVLMDSTTEEFERDKVERREVIIAFSLDKERNLVPMEAGATYGGIYSFLPLGEERTGAKFLIQADFLAVPGREALHYEAKWNHWLIEKVAELCKEAIEDFKSNGPEKWRFQFLPLFDFVQFPGQDSFDKLLGPKLVAPLVRFLLEENTCVFTVSGKWVKISEAVFVPEDNLNDVMNIVQEDELPNAFPGRKAYIDPRTKFADNQRVNLKEILSVFDLLRESEALNRKARQTNAPEFFRNLYLGVHKRSSGYSQRGYARRRGYMRGSYILTRDSKLETGNSVYLLQPIEGEALNRLEELGVPEKSRLQQVHPSIFAHTSEDERHALIDFLLNDADVKALDYVTIVEDYVLPRLRSDAEPPPKGTLVDLTRSLKTAADRGLWLHGEIYVLNEAGSIRPSTQVFLSSKYQPDLDWEKNRQYAPDLDFLSEEYVQLLEPADVRGWRDFFKRLGVREEPPDTIVERFAIEIAKKEIKTRFDQDARSVDKLRFGYDLEVQMQDGSLIGIEVKGRSKEEDIKLEPGETSASQRLGNAYYLYVVCPIPNDPKLFVVQNPLRHGDIEGRLTVKRDMWKRFGVTY